MSTSEDDCSRDARIDMLQKDLEQGLRDLGVELGVTVDDFNDNRTHQSQECISAQRQTTIGPGAGEALFLLSQPALDAASCEKPHPIERHAKSFSNKTDEEEWARSPRQRPVQDAQRYRPASALSMHPSAQSKSTGRRISTKQR